MVQSEAADMLNAVIAFEGNKVGLHPSFHEVKWTYKVPRLFSFQATNDVEVY